MLKLYIKKLFLSLLFWFVFFLFFVVVTYVWLHVVPGLESFFKCKFTGNFNISIQAVITLLLELLAVYFVRIDSPNYKKPFQKAKIEKAFSRDFWDILKSAENIVHTVANLTLILLFSMLISATNQSPAVHTVLRTLFLLIAGGILFAVINTALWCIIHKRWIHEFKKSPDIEPT